MSRAAWGYGGDGWVWPVKEEDDKGGGGRGGDYCPSFTASKDRV